MTSEQQAAFIMAQAACAMAEIAGMQAENQAKQHQGLPPTYNGSHFIEVTERNVIGHNAVLSLYQG